MVNNLFTLLLTFILSSALYLPVLSQEGSKQEEGKETPAQEKAEKGKVSEGGSLGGNRHTEQQG
jgi:hypothetical protein